MFKEKKLSANKLRGGYYTPKEISDFLCNWAIRKQDDKVLEPSCGDGSFIESAIHRLKKLKCNDDKISQQVLGIELFEEEAKKALARAKKILNGSTGKPIKNYDFFSYSKDFFLDTDSVDNVLKKEFDVIIGNPPFIRYHNFPEKHREIAFKIMESMGFSPNKLTNIWLPFLIISAHLLKDKGRLAMVIPSELFQVKYASEARLFLSKFFKRISIVSFKKLVFDEIQQEIILLLCEKDAPVNKSGIRSIELNDANDLSNFSFKELEKTKIKPIEHSLDKWTQYYLSTEEILLLRKIKESKKVKLAKDYISVDVGVVTGKNDFFLLTQEQVKQKKFENHSCKIVARSQQLEGLVFGNSDWKRMAKTGNSVSMFLPDKHNGTSKNVLEYIELGEKHKINTGYKCSIRKEWYRVPSIWVPDAFALRQVHGYPKLILNNSDAISTDTIHRVKFTNGVPGKNIVCSFLNSLTFAFSEVMGRSYGGGVLTFEPSEIEELPLPVKNAGKINYEEIDLLLREKKIDDVLNITDQILLKQGYGFSNKEIQMLRGIWIKMRNRRINRK